MRYHQPDLQAMLWHSRIWFGSRRWVFILAAAPAVLFALTSTKAKPKAPPTYIEQTTQGDSFTERFGQDGPTVIRVRTIPIVRTPTPSVPAPEAPPSTIPVAEPTPPVRQREAAVRVSRRGDICTKHNMRKVKVGRYRWRCRR